MELKNTEKQYYILANSEKMAKRAENLGYKENVMLYTEKIFLRMNLKN